MKAVTLNFSRESFKTQKEYKLYLTNILKRYEDRGECLVVLPGNSGLMLALSWGELGTPVNFREAYKTYLELPVSWHKDLLSLHVQAARQLSLFLVCGTDILTMNGKNYLVSYLISPQGRILGCQKQLYLSQKERSLGISRGDDAEVFSTPLGKIGLVVGTDAFYPEVGRILALKEADIVCHCGALPIKQETDIPNYWRQMTGMWPQVQQNQFFCVESQLVSTIAGQHFKGSSFILAPCEMTGDKSGFLAWGGPGPPDEPPREKLSREELTPEIVEANLDFKAREKVIKNYPLLKLLNPAAYRPLQCLKGQD